MTRDVSATHPPLAPLSKEDFAYDTLRNAILAAELAPGALLYQADIAQRLGMSPIPVRGALKRLIVEGLVVQEPHCTPRVAKLEIRELEEAMLIRAHLEILAIKEAVPRLTPLHLATIERLLGELDLAVEKKDMLRFGMLNRDFHFAIYDASPYPLLVQMIRDLWSKTDRYRSRKRFTSVPSLAERSQRDHQQILGCLARGSAEKAARLIEKHNSESQRLFLASLKSEREDEARGREEGQPRRKADAPRGAGNAGANS